MLLTSENLKQIKFKQKRVKLQKAEDTEILVALLPASLIAEVRDLQGNDAQSEESQAVGLKILMTAVVDEEGKPVFTKSEDYEALPLAIQHEILEAVFEYNGLTESSRNEIEKN